MNKKQLQVLNFARNRAKYGNWNLDLPFISHQYKNIKLFCHYRAFTYLLPISLRKLQKAIFILWEAVLSSRAALSFLDLHLVNDAQIASLNFQFMDKIGVTNILSFPGDANLAGCLVLSLDTYGRECILYGQNPLTYLRHLISHGIAHLAGYEHGDEMEAFIANLKKISFPCLM